MLRNYSVFRCRTVFLQPLKIGDLSEWLKEHAWKVCIPQKGIEGSNPSVSAGYFARRCKILQMAHKQNFAFFVECIRKQENACFGCTFRDQNLSGYCNVSFCI